MAALTVVNLGAWLGLNVYAATRDPDAVCLAAFAPGVLLWWLWLFGRGARTEGDTEGG
jgi:hypothetical protein